MNPEELDNLLKRYNEGNIDEEKRAALELWYLKYASESDEKLSAESEHKMAEALRNSLPLVYKTRRFNLWPRIASAAAIAAMVIAVAFWFGEDLLKEAEPAEISYANDIKPGKNSATLTLADGKRIHISDAPIGTLALESGVKISKNSTGQVVYEIPDEATGTEGKTNSLETAEGEQIEVRLPDGTIVFLNSASSLTYPSSFANANQRIVSLRGEGFFDVQSDKEHPFILNTQGQKIEVLGTQFNVNSYPEERAIKTTLLEGSVKLSTADSYRVLKPGQQASVFNDTIATENVETEYAIAWRNGYFMFNNETLETIMTKLSRWYNVEVVYEDEGLRNKVFFGSISKFENISKVLRVMQRTNVAQFQIQDDKVLINKMK